MAEDLSRGTWKGYPVRSHTGLGSFEVRCDGCGLVAPDRFGPMLRGMGWSEYLLKGRGKLGRWEAGVLVCPRCKGPTLQGRAVRTFAGGRFNEPRWPDGMPDLSALKREHTADLSFPPVFRSGGE